MSLPAYKVEIAFTTPPLDPAPAWVDITGYVLYANGVSIQRGRGDEFELIGPSSLSLMLNNKDGRFSPDNPSSVYYPNVKKGRLIRVSAAGAPRFTGYVDSWGTTWPGGNSASSYVDVRAMSRMARMGRGAELPDIISCVIDLGSPGAHYTMGEPEGAVQAHDSSGNAVPPLVQAGTGTAVVFGTATGPGTDGLTGATLTNGGRSLVAYDATGVQSGLGFFISTAGFAAGTFTARMGGIIIDITDTGAISASTVFGASIGPVASSVTDGGVHHVELDTSAGSTVLYVDGVSVGSVAVGGAVVGKFGASFAVAGVGSSGTGTVSLSHIVSDVQGAAAIWAAGTTGFAGDTPADRLARLATYAGIPAASLVADTGSATNLPHRDTTGRTVLDLMQEVTATENGTLFDGKDGTLVFQGRDHRYTATVAATFAPAVDLAPVLDDYGVANEVTATGDGVSALVRDEGSIDDHGLYRVSVELMTTSADDVYQAAAWRVGTTAQPKTRIPTATANLHGMSAAVRDRILALEIGDRITLTNLPTQAPATSMDFFIEGYSEQITHMTHVWTANLSPAAAYVGTFLFDSASRGFDVGTFAY